MQDQYVCQVLCDHRRDIEQRITQSEYHVRIKRVPHRRPYTSTRIGRSVGNRIPPRGTVPECPERRREPGIIGLEKVEGLEERGVERDEGEKDKGDDGDEDGGNRFLHGANCANKTRRWCPCLEESRRVKDKVYAVIYPSLAFHLEENPKEAKERPVFQQGGKGGQRPQPSTCRT